MARANRRFTVYDMLEENGEFEKNPANTQARDPVTGQSTYAGPVEFPKMMYHPTGETRITVPAEIITTPIGPKAVGEQREIIYKIVNTPEEEKALRDEGWHNRPVAAMAISRGEAPPVSKDDQIAALQAQLAQLMLERNSPKSNTNELPPLKPPPSRMTTTKSTDISE